MSHCNEYYNNILLYLDDELSSQDLEDFRGHIRECPNCRTQLEEEEALSHCLHNSRPLYSASEALHARVAATISRHASSNAPDRLHRRVMDILLQPLRDVALSSFSWRSLAAAVLVMAVGLAFVPGLVEQARATAFVEAAVASHRSYLNGNLPLEIRSDSPEEVSAWFADKVPFHFRLPASQVVPDDGTPAYRLTGARLVNYKRSYAALVTYEMQQEKISLLVASDKSAVSAGGDQVRSSGLIFHYRNNGSLKVITWSNHGLTYALVSSPPGSAQQSCLVCHQTMADHNTFSSH
jgi:anti-sigma factor RsiW